MRSERHRPLLFWLAVATAATALLPIVVGALVTSLDAGMAFPDWPTSDGQGMFSYPWLKSAGDKFIEHGHRLAGIVIGCVSIALAVATALLEPRRYVRWSGAAVLLAVVAQGLLGGGRVLSDDRSIAMIHGAFAATVFALMSSVAVLFSRSWISPPLAGGGINAAGLKIVAAATPVVILAQYLLGGLVRHRGTALFEHVGMAFVVLAFVVATVVAVHRARCNWLRRPADAMGALIICQVALGAAAWVSKFGFPAMNYVAVQRSPMQIAIRTSHTVVGMLLFMASVVLLLRTARVDSILRAARGAVGESGAKVDALRHLSAGAWEGGRL